MLVLRNVRKQHARAGLQWAFKGFSQALARPACALCSPGGRVGKAKPVFAKIGGLGIIGISAFQCSLTGRQGKNMRWPHSQRGRLSRSVVRINSRICSKERSGEGLSILWGLGPPHDA